MLFAPKKRINRIKNYTQPLASILSLGVHLYGEKLMI